MAKFRYRAYGLRGDYAEGTIDAPTLDSVGGLLALKGLTAFSVRAESGNGPAWWQREVFSFAGSRTELPQFTRELATLVGVGITLTDALRILSERGSSEWVRQSAALLIVRVLDGRMLSDAMREQSAKFPLEYISIVRAGELGGMLQTSLSEMADLLERRSEIRSRLQSALIYPAILFVLSLVSLAVIVGALVPNIAPIFSESSKPMPTVIWLLSVLHLYWGELMGGAALMLCLVAGLAWSLMRTESGRSAWSKQTLRLPLVGGWICIQQTSIFVRTLGTLLRSGVPLLQACVTANTTLSNKHLAGAVEAAIEALGQGASLHAALERVDQFPAVAVQLIGIGEQAGKLDQVLLRLANMFDQDLQRKTERVMTVLTPVLTIIIAGMIGSIILPVMSAVLSLNDVAFR
jgi:general secretion pathway protein F